MTPKPRSIAVDGHYSFTEAAIILGKSARTIYRWRKMGYLPETKSRFTQKGYILGKHILRAFEALC